MNNYDGSVKLAEFDRKKAVAALQVEIRLHTLNEKIREIMGIGLDGFLLTMVGAGWKLDSNGKFIKEDGSHETLPGALSYYLESGGNAP